MKVETSSGGENAAEGWHAPPWLAAGLLLLLLLKVGLGAWSHRSAAISADPYTYISFARNLAEGRFFAENEASRVVQGLWKGTELTEGPVWNTHVRADGRTVYTVGIGLPLFLAGVLKTAGLPGVVYVNHLLLLGVLLLLVACLREGWGRTTYSATVAAVAIMALLYSSPNTYLQFARAWREPLFYVCVLGGALALLRFLRTGRPAWAGGMAFLLGYACCIKEANLVYAACLGVYLLCSARFRAHPGKLVVLGAAAAFGFLGLLPILVQNALSTGNPFISLQFAHSASNFVSPHGAGLTAGNLFTIPLWYLELYYEDGGILFWVPALVWVGVGVARGVRHSAGRILLALGGVHAFLYMQWGHAEFRHMYFAHLPYCVFLALGFFAMLDALARRYRLTRYREALLCLVLAVAALWPLPWGPKPAAANRYEVADARRLGEVLQQTGPGRTLYFSNRKLRDVIGTLTDLEVLRLSELTWFGPEDGVERAVDWYLGQGVRLFLLDNVDLDPRWAGTVDMTRMDQERLSERYDLREVLSIPAWPYKLKPFLARGVDMLRAYEVKPRTETRVRRVVPVPEGGAAFLWVHPRSLGERLTVRADGREVPSEAGHYYRALHEFAVSNAVTVEADAGGERVPALEDLRVVGWEELIAIDFGPDAAPRDAPFFGAPLGEQPQRRERHVASPVTLRLPVREGPDFFTVAGLGIRPLEEPSSNAAFRVRSGGGPPVPLASENDLIWFPLHAGHTHAPWAGVADVELRAGLDGKLAVRRARLYTAHRVLRHQPAPGARALGVWGSLAPDEMGRGSVEWAADLNGVPARAGRCFDNPRRTSNRFAWMIETPAPGAPVEIRFHGAGLIQPRWVEVTDRVEIDMGPEAEVFLAEGFYPPENEAADVFRWSGARSVVRVPVSSGVRSYRLVLDLWDGRPPELAAQGERTLHCRVAGAETVLVLPAVRDRVELRVEASNLTSGLEDLVFECQTWIPAEHLRSGDARELGFQCFALRWEPAQ